MAWSSAALSADELAQMAADKPILGGSQVLEDATDAQWRQSGSFASGSDETDSDWPARRAYDRQDYLQTRPDSSQNTWYMIFQLPAVEFDFLAIFNHGMGGETVSAEVADDNAFSTNLQEIYSVTAGGGRIVSFSLKHTGSDALRYSSVDYFRLKVVGTNILPRLGEIWLGRRRQLDQQPLVPWDEKAKRSSVDYFESASGVRHAYIRNQGQRLMAATFNPHTTTYKDAIENWFSDCDYGGSPFVYCDKPTTSPTDAVVMSLDAPELVFPQVGPFERNVTIMASELGPNYLALES